jgi:hypothetical protein
MNKLFLLAGVSLALFASAQAWAASACVVYVENNGAPVSVQVSCDGADLKEIFQASGISSGVSKAIPYYLAKGYSFNGCTDSHSDGSNGTAYSRCFFVKN